MAKTAKKRAWKNFKVTRIKLNPEQAVLACCAHAAKPLSDVSIENHCWQWDFDPCYGSKTWDTPSS
jgi:hypothetical protein